MALSAPSPTAASPLRQEKLAAAMNIFFDVDHTLIDDDHGLRPMVKEAFAELRSDGHQLSLWSGIGPRWEIVQQHQLEPWIDGCYDKPLYRHHQMLKPLGIDTPPDCVIDDHSDPVSVFGGVVVRPYRTRDDEDREMERVVVELRRLCEQRQTV